MNFFIVRIFQLMRSAHKTLMQGVRGDKKQPGVFRMSQNWIGGATIKDAIFIKGGTHFMVVNRAKEISKIIKRELSSARQFKLSQSRPLKKAS